MVGEHSTSHHCHLSLVLSDHVHDARDDELPRPPVHQHLVAVGLLLGLRRTPALWLNESLPSVFAQFSQSSMIPRRVSAMREVAHPQSLDIHYRPGQAARSSPPSPIAQDTGISLSPLATPRSSPRLAPLLPSASQDTTPLSSPVTASMENESSPRICGLPLKYVSCVFISCILCKVLSSFD